MKRLLVGWIVLNMMMIVAPLGMMAQSSFMSYSENKEEGCIEDLDGAGGVRILSKRSDLVVTVNNAPSAKITPKGKRADGYYVYDVVVNRSDTKTPKIEINKRGDIDKIDFVVNTKADFFLAFVVNEVEKPIRCEDQTKANDVITNAKLAELEINSPIEDLQIDCPKELGATITSSKKSTDKSITITTITFPVEQIVSTKKRLSTLQAELNAIDERIKQEFEKPKMTDKQRDELSVSRDEKYAELEKTEEFFARITHIDLFAKGTNRLTIDISEAAPRKKFCWGVLLRTVVVKEHVTDFNAKFSEGARLFSLREYDNARRNFIAAKNAKDAPGDLLPSVMRNIADCDTCILYDRLSRGALTRMKEMRQAGSGNQKEVVRYASAASEFLSVLNKYNPCDFYTERIEKLDKMVEEMPLDVKFTITQWVQSVAGYAEGGRLARVEIWADSGKKMPSYKEFQTDKKFKQMIGNDARYKLLGESNNQGEIEVHLNRKALPNGLFFRPVGYGNRIAIKYMDVKEIMRQSEGDYMKRQFRLKMYVDKK